MSLFTYYDESEVETLEPVFKKRTFSDETRSKMSIARVGKKFSTETRAKISLSKRGRKHSKEAITKQAESQRSSYHLRAKWIWVTPVGEFITASDAASANNLSRDRIVYRCRYETVAGFSRKELDKSNESV